MLNCHLSIPQFDLSSKGGFDCPFCFVRRTPQARLLMTNVTSSNSSLQSAPGIDAQLEQRLAGLANDNEAAVEATDVGRDSVFQDHTISQQWIRRQDEGFDTLSGHFRCAFSCEQQRYALHIPLYPAMEEVPDVEATVVDCETAKIRVTDRQKFGLRLEVILEQPALEACQVLVELTAYAKIQN